MKINQVQNTNQNAALLQKTEEGSRNRKAGQKNGSINGANLNLVQDDITKRKQQLQKSAMDLIRNQFSADSNIDRGLEESRDLIAKKRGLADEAMQNINELSEDQDNLKELYGITDDSNEQQDLELRLKIREAYKPGSNVELTKDDIEKYRELEPMTEYQQRYMEIENMKSPHQAQLENANNDVAIISQGISSIKKEMVKNQGMIDAENGAEKIMEAASKEVIGKLINDAKDKVEEEQEEETEKAEEIKEKKEEQEAIKNDKNSEQKTNEKTTEIVADTKDMQAEMDAELKKMLEQQKLLEEDLKGIDVDIAF